jgi:hypothetical protein
VQQAVYGWCIHQEVSMTAEEFAEAIDKLIGAARDGGLSDAKISWCSRMLDEGLSEAWDRRLGRGPDAV